MNHAYVAEPFGRDCCDALYDDGGRPRRCARKRNDPVHAVEKREEATTMTDTTKRLGAYGACAGCPHSMLILCAQDFCVGRALAEAMVRMGHDVHTQHVRLSPEEFEAYVLTKALPTVDPKIMEVPHA